MKQAWITKSGAPEVIELREAPDPTPGHGEVRIRVHASGVNFADIMARLGLYPDAPPLPTVVGYEVSGVVDAVGAGVSGVSAGDRVVSLSRFGGYSDVVCVPAGWTAPVPERLSFEQAAAIPVNYLTAWLMLVHLGNVREGDRVLVHAAAGGVGQAALQICRWKGAEVIGTASAGKHERLREAGVAHCIDYRNEDVKAGVLAATDGRGVDIVLDAIGGRSYRDSYDVLAPLGRLYVFGATSAAPGTRRNLFAAAKAILTMPRFAPIPMMNDNRGVMGVNLGHLWDQAEAMSSMLREILSLTDEGVFAPVVDATFPLSRAGEAHAYIQARKNFGKVVLDTTC